jgi:hypothetical protein
MTNSSSGGAGFDPRFNPAFQPGYKPEVHGQPAQPSAPAPGLDPQPAAGSPGRGEGHGERWRDDPRRVDPREADAGASDPPVDDPRRIDPRVVDPRASDSRARDPRRDGAVDADRYWDETGSRRHHREAERGVEEEPLSRRFDAYLVCLWVVSVAFVASGLAVVTYISQRLDKLSLTDGGNGFDYYLLQVYTIAAPLLVLLGLATAVGTLFLLAGRHGRRTID